MATRQVLLDGLVKLFILYIHFGHPKSKWPFEGSFRHDQKGKQDSDGRAEREAEEEELPRNKLWRNRRQNHLRHHHIPTPPLPQQQQQQQEHKQHQLLLSLQQQYQQQQQQRTHFLGLRFLSINDGTLTQAFKKGGRGDGSLNGLSPSPIDVLLRRMSTETSKRDQRRRSDGRALRFAKSSFICFKKYVSVSDVPLGEFPG